MSVSEAGPLTAAELTRIAAEAFDVEIRVWVLPPREFITGYLFNAGEPATNFPATTLLTGDVGMEFLVSADGTTIPVTSTANYPVAGRAALRDDEGALIWFEYTGKTATTFTGAKWSSGDVADFLVAKGAYVSPGVDISDDVQDGSLTVEEWEALPIYDWRARLAGENYDERLYLPDATVLIEERLSPDSSPDNWSDWLVVCVGYAARGWEVEADADGHRSWSVSLQSISAYVNRFQLMARQYGNTDLAAGHPATVSSTLGSPLLEPEEFAGGWVPISGDNLTDGSLRSAWISAQAPNVTAEEMGTGRPLTNHGPHFIVDEVLPVPAGSGPQWFVLRLAQPLFDANQGVHLAGYRITTKFTLEQGGFAPSGVSGWPDEVWHSFIPLPDIELTRGQPAIVLTSNRQAFLDLYGPAEIAIYDWNELRSADGQNLPLTLQATDVIHIRLQLNDFPHHITDMAAWGDWDVVTGGRAAMFVDNDHDHGNTPHWGTSEAAIDDGVPLGAAGTSIRRTPLATDTNRAADWAVEEEPLPGDVRIIAAREQVRLDLGLWTCTLAGGISDSETGWIAVTNPVPLGPGPGTIRIDSEYLSFDQTAALTGDATRGTHLHITARGQEGSTPTTHNAGADVYLYEAGVGATRHYATSKIDLLRQPVLEEGVAVRPQEVAIYASRVASPAADPPSADWSLMFRGVFPPDDSPHWQIVATPHRARHIAVDIHQMTDGGRAKLNLVRVWHLYSLSVADGRESGLRAVVRDLAEQLLPAEDITFVGEVWLGTIEDVAILGGSLGQALEDICRSTLVVMRYTRDGRIEFAYHPLHPARARPPVRVTLDGSMVREPQGTRYASRVGLAQVRVIFSAGHMWGVPATVEAAFPPRAGLGQIKEIHLNGGSSYASYHLVRQIAEAYYLDDPAVSHTYHFKTTGPAPGLSAGQRVMFEVHTGGETTVTKNGRIVALRYGPDGVAEGDIKEWRMGYGA